MHMDVLLALTHKVQSLPIHIQLYIMLTDHMLNKHLHCSQTLPLVTAIRYMIACRLHVQTHSLHSRRDVICVLSECYNRFNGILTQLHPYQPL